MRGDSLRDFYAKTLAVVGLGLLAAAGAIVDYWPVNGEWPSVSAVTALRSHRPLPRPALATEVAAPRSIRVSHASSRRDNAPAFAKAFRTVKFADPVVVPLEPMPLPELDLSGLESASAATLLAMSSLDLDLVPPMQEAFGSIGGGALTTPRAILTGAVGALKKTRLSLREAFRGVVGRIRKVSPFWDSSMVPLG